MSTLVWKPEYSVGIDELDKQHLQLFDLINIALDDLADDPDPAIVAQLLLQMTRYAAAHFKTEERIMAKRGYPQLEHHSQLHQTYQNEVAALCVAAMELDPTVANNLRAFLLSWWGDHLLKEDMAYRDFFAKQKQ